MNTMGPELSEIRRRMPVNPAHMHGDDLRALGLRDGDRIELHGEAGAIPAIVKMDANVRPGVVSMNHGWGVLPDEPSDYLRDGASTCLLVASDRCIEAINGMPRMTAIPVAIRKVLSFPSPPDPSPTSGRGEMLAPPPRARERGRGRGHNSALPFRHPEHNPVQSVGHRYLTRQPRIRLRLRHAFQHLQFEFALDGQRTLPLGRDNRVAGAAHHAAVAVGVDAGHLVRFRGLHHAALRWHIEFDSCAGGSFKNQSDHCLPRLLDIACQYCPTTAAQRGMAFRKRDFYAA